METNSVGEAVLGGSEGTIQTSYSPAITSLAPARNIMQIEHNTALLASK